MNILFDIYYDYNNENEITLWIIEYQFNKKYFKYGEYINKYKQTSNFIKFSSFKDDKQERYIVKITDKNILNIKEDLSLSENIQDSLKKAEKILIFELKKSKNMILKKNIVKLLNKIRNKRKENDKNIAMFYS